MPDSTIPINILHNNEMSGKSGDIFACAHQSYYHNLAILADFDPPEPIVITVYWTWESPREPFLFPSLELTCGLL